MLENQFTTSCCWKNFDVVIPGTVNNELNLSSFWLVENLKLLGVDIHLEQGVGKDVSKATSIEETVRLAIVLVIIDLRELKAAILQELITVELFMGEINLSDHDWTQNSERLNIFGKAWCTLTDLIIRLWKIHSLTLLKNERKLHPLINNKFIYFTKICFQINSVGSLFFYFFCFTTSMFASSTFTAFFFHFLPVHNAAQKPKTEESAIHVVMTTKSISFSFSVSALLCHKKMVGCDSHTWDIEQQLFTCMVPIISTCCKSCNYWRAESNLSHHAG